MRHKEIQAEVTQLQNEVVKLEKRKEAYVEERKKEMIEKCKKAGLINGTQIPDAELERICRQFLMNEITATLSYRKKLESKLAQYELDIVASEKEISALQIQHAAIQQHQKLQTVSPKSAGSTPLGQRKDKNIARSRSQEWPDIPDVGKINENNPEVLAKKILETGRKIEAGKLPRKSPERTTNCKRKSGGNNSMIPEQSLSYKDDIPAPKVNFYEDRLKSIITSVLNEDNTSGGATNGSHHQAAISNATKNPPPSCANPYQQQPHPNLATVTSANGMMYQIPRPPSAPDGRSHLSTPPPRSSPNEASAQKKKLQLSPDIIFGYSNNRGSSSPAGPGKAALRTHLANNNSPPVRNLNFGPGDKPRSIQDLMSNEIESSLAGNFGGCRRVPQSTGSPQFRAVYSPISRPNSNENIPESLASGFQGSRATVLVSNNLKSNGMDEGMNEGLAAGLKARILSLSKTSSPSPNLESNSGSKNESVEQRGNNNRSMENSNPLLNSPLVKGRKFVEGSNGRVTVEVLLESSEGPEDLVPNDKNMDSSNASVLRVVRKRVNETMNVSFCIFLFQLSNPRINECNS